MPRKRSTKKSSSKKSVVTTISDLSANPAPLGLMGFGMSTVLLNLHNAGYFALGSMVVAMGLFYGGISQVIVGFMEWKKGNTFGETAFLSYGLFWLTLVGIILFPRMGIIEAPSAVAMGWYLLLWGVFSFGLFIATLKLSRILQIIFGLLTVLFVLLAASDFTGNAQLKMLAGYEGIFVGLLAMYTSIAQVLNEVYGKKVLPI